MIEAIKSFFLDTVGRELCVFFCSMIPIIELRLAVPLGAGLGLAAWQTFCLAVIGNLLPVPFLLLLCRWILSLMHRIRWTRRFAAWLEKKAERSRDKVERFEFWGLALFVGIPLPGTGTWTGVLVASVIKMRFWKAMFAITVGALMAAGIMTLLSYGAVAAFDLWFS